MTTVRWLVSICWLVWFLSLTLDTSITSLSWSPSFSMSMLACTEMTSLFLQFSPEIFSSPFSDSPTSKTWGTAWPSHFSSLEPSISGCTMISQSPDGQKMKGGNSDSISILEDSPPSTMRNSSLSACRYKSWIYLLWWCRSLPLEVYYNSHIKCLTKTFFLYSL